MTYEEEIKLERPLSEGDQIKIAIRTMFEERRKGQVITSQFPLKIHINNVNGVAEKNLCLHPHESQRGAIVMWYEDLDDKS